MPELAQRATETQENFYLRVSHRFPSIIVPCFQATPESQGAICLSILNTLNHWPREAYRKPSPGVNGVVDFKAQKLEASVNCTS